MIRFLAIRRLAVIDALEIELEDGLNVLTGETGAGKSIIVEALGLLVGGRASADLVRTGEQLATIQAIFETPDGREIAVRREISAQGRSRAFIDDTLATTAALKELSGRLVDLHGQHEHQALLDPRSHLDVLDHYAGLEAERDAAGAAYREFRALADEIARLASADREKTARADFLAFQLGEIDQAAPRAGEDQELGALRQVLANADRLQRLCAESYTAVYEGEGSVLSTLAGVWKRLGELAALDPKFGPYLEARDPLASQLEDLAFFLRRYASDIDASPERLADVEGRLAQIERLKKKYGPTLSDVLARQASLRAELEALDTSSERMTRLTRDLESARARYQASAGTLSAARRAQAPSFARAIEAQLAELAMNRTRCEVRFRDGLGEAAWTDRGLDEAELFLSPNPGEELRPLARIASGGELSRVMLAVKTLASVDAPGKTLVFDEVDAGIGGRVADVVGRRLRQLGERFQILCITHLPQIAAAGRTHYFVAKQVRAGRTLARVERLDRDMRVEELARMMAGAQISEAVRTSARQLLAAGDESSTKGESERAKAKGRRVG